jgi:prepilin-type N-terminal cleavage/methylation domain-containing protein
MPRRRDGAVRSRYGFTLVETLIVVVLLGLIVLIGFPKISAAMGKSDLRSARTTMVNLVATARAASVQANRLTWIKFEGNSAYVIARPRLTVGGAGDVDTIGTVHDLNGQYKVGVTASTDSIQFDPRGFGAWTGGDVSIVLSRGDHYETINIDGLGRVTK